MDRKMEDFSYGRCFSIIYRHGKVMNDKFTKKFKMSGLQHYYLMEICKNPGISQETLARHHRIDRGAMSKAIKRMADMGYLRREQNPEDNSRHYTGSHAGGTGSGHRHAHGIIPGGSSGADGQCGKVKNCLCKRQR